MFFRGVFEKCQIALLIGFVVASTVWADDAFVLDHRYKPGEWQTAIGLPDDWQKSVIDKGGELLYDYPRGFGEFATRIEFALSKGPGEWVGQKLETPKVPVVETVRTWGDIEMTARSFSVTDQSVKTFSELKPPAIAPDFTGSPRTDLMLVTLKNTGASAQTVEPRINIRSTHKLVWDEGQGNVSIRNWRMVNSSLKPVGVKEEPHMLVMQLPKVVLKAGKSETVAVSIGSNAEGQIWSVREARKALEKARKYWNTLDLPYGVVNVPDEMVQAQLDAAIRNIYQAREIKNGLPSFQVGPTCYRGLWIVDGAFILESITHLNRSNETRAGVQHMLTFQKEDGSMAKMGGSFWKENGIMLWIINRHAQLTGDEKWLNENWKAVEGIMNFIPVLRERSRQDPNALSYDFIPLGYPDGGLEHCEEYTNAYWLLVGMKSAVQMARQMNRPDQVAAWQKQYDELWMRLRTLAKRDMITDEFGNRMLPIPMERPLKCKPQQGQWGFMHAAYPGLIFEKDDPILVGNLANLSANRCEGLVLGTGWDPEGLWNYAGSFFAHTQLAAGDGIEAAKTAYAFANHASPLLAWREEQRPIDHPEPHYVGDMPHNWASAEFIRLILHLIVFERDNELHLFEGLPPTWLYPGAELKIDKALTRFGEVSLTLKVAKNGKIAKLDVIPPTRTPAAKVVVHGGHWLADGRNLDLSTTEPSGLKLKLK